MCHSTESINKQQNIRLTMHQAKVNHLLYNTLYSIGFQKLIILYVSHKGDK